MSDRVHRFEQRPMSDDQGDRIIELLTEIRDRLRPPPPQAVAPPVATTMFGYVRGSGEYPTESQYRLAYDFLNGGRPWQERQMDGEAETAALNLCREIVGMVKR